MNSSNDKFITAFFELIADQGWQSASLASAALRAGMPMAEARACFPHRWAVLKRFGERLDQAVLATLSEEMTSDAAEPQTVRGLVFDALMQRIDGLQPHRRGVIALLKALPLDPCATLFLSRSTMRSMRWILGASGANVAGVTGALRVMALNGVWVQLVRAWQKDQTGDLSATMAALDKMLDQMEKAQNWLCARKKNQSCATPANKLMVDEIHQTMQME